MPPLDAPRPEVIDTPRRRRIARGSGNDLQAVHGLIKNFKQMQKMLGKVGKGGGLPQDLLGGSPRKGFRTRKGMPRMPRGSKSPGSKFPGSGFPGGSMPPRKPFYAPRGGA